jgi:Xaa-Pro aminopeptidase
MGDHIRPDWSGRLRRIWRAGEAPPAPAFLVSAPTNIAYLTGFEGTAGFLLLTPADATLLLDGRYATAARSARASGDLADVRICEATEGLDRELGRLIKELPSGDVAFEADHVTVSALRAWQRAHPSRTFQATAGWVEGLRRIKDGYELAVLRRACARLSDVARHLPDWVAEGRSERAIARDIETALFRAGFARPAFPTIVASGPNSAHPHARPTDRVLQRGDLVVLDFGGVLDGYCGDLTRMAAVGQVEAAARAMYEAVRAAQEAAIGAVRAGVAASSVDAAARQVLTNHGLGEAFLHATGHGLGLDVHEGPRLGRADADRAESLEAGMVCTIEPGAYVEGLGGVRLEDDVVVTMEGCEVLTEAPRDLVIV